MQRETVEHIMVAAVSGIFGVALGMLLQGTCAKAEIEWYGDHSKVPDVQEQYQRGQDRDTQDMFNQALRERLEHRDPC